MREIQLIRAPGDKRKRGIPGVGSVRFENRWGTKLEFASTAGVIWRIDGRGPFRRSPDVVDVTGRTVATYGRGRVESAGRVIEVTTPHQGPLDRRPPFLIVEDGRDLARCDPRVWDEKPLDVTILDEDFAARDPLLLLLALYVANTIAGSRQAAAGAGGVT